MVIQRTKTTTMKYMNLLEKCMVDTELRSRVNTLFEHWFDGSVNKSNYTSLQDYILKTLFGY